MLFVDRKGWLPKGRLVSIYFIGYGIGRAWVEALRIDPANEIFGLRINLWMSLVLVITGLVILLWPKGAASSPDIKTDIDDDDDEDSTNVDSDAAAPRRYR